MSFRDRLRRIALEKGSRVVLALDLRIPQPGELLEGALRMIEEVSEGIVAVKLNQHVILPLGIPGVRTLVERCGGLDLPCIADLKLGDIGDTNRWVARLLYENGFDALIASPLPGMEDGLAPLMEEARAQGRGVLLLAYMSHRGADEVFGVELKAGGRLYQRFIQLAQRLGADGIVVGATRPSLISEARALLGPEGLILAPGVGVQGGRADATRFGADFIIVGRAIIDASNPREALERIRRESWGG